MIWIIDRNPFVLLIWMVCHDQRENAPKNTKSGPAIAEPFLSIIQFSIIFRDPCDLFPVENSKPAVLGFCNKRKSGARLYRGYPAESGAVSCAEVYFAAPRTDGDTCSYWDDGAFL